MIWIRMGEWRFLRLRSIECSLGWVTLVRDFLSFDCERFLWTDDEERHQSTYDLKRHTISGSCTTTINNIALGIFYDILHLSWAIVASVPATLETPF